MIGRKVEGREAQLKQQICSLKQFRMAFQQSGRITVGTEPFSWTAEVRSEHMGFPDARDGLVEWCQCRIDELGVELSRLSAEESTSQGHPPKGQIEMALSASAARA